MTPLAAFLLSHGARTIPSSRLAKEVIHLGNRPVCFTTWYKTSILPSTSNGAPFQETPSFHFTVGPYIDLSNSEMLGMLFSSETISNDDLLKRNLLKKLLFVLGH